MFYFQMHAARKKVCPYEVRSKKKKIKIKITEVTPSSIGNFTRGCKMI